MRLPTGPTILPLRRSLLPGLVLLTAACAVGDGPRIIPEALTQAAEYETGNLSVVERRAHRQQQA